MTQSEDNFIGRWSRRKKAQEKEAKIPQSATEDRELAAQQTAEPDREAGLEVSSQQAGDVESATLATTNEQLAEPVAPTDADMVALDTLDANSDYAPFMSEGVSSELRKAALKKLFFSGKFAARDGLDDYDDDFTHFEPLGDTVTSDMKFHARRKEKERLAKLEQERLAREAQEQPVSENETSESDGADPVEADPVETPGSDSSDSSDSSDNSAPERVESEQVPTDQVESPPTPELQQDADGVKGPSDFSTDTEVRHAAKKINQQEYQTDPDSGKTA